MMLLLMSLHHRDSSLAALAQNDNSSWPIPSERQDDHE